MRVNQHIVTLIEMTDKIQNNLNKYINNITLINQGIIRYNLINATLRIKSYKYQIQSTPRN